MTVLVTGAGGQLGRAALRELGADGIGLRHAELDVTNSAAVLAAAQQHQPTLILHAAAWTDVDGAETDRDGAYRANVLANRHVAEAAKAVGARLVTVSTDFVFDGRKGEPYVESDETNPISYYGETKLLGEQAALEAYPEGTWVVRTAWVYDEQGTNFPRLIMRLSETRDVLRVVEDQVGSPTYAGHLAPLLLSLPDVVPAGVLHLAGSGAATRREWAEAVLAEAGRTTVVEGATSDEFPTPAERPSYSALGSERSETPILPPWRLGVAACMAGYVA
jgi:dTDP-4-dehydrorhamnose reductase